MAPASTVNVPATALSNVDLPEPFIPMTTTTDPFSICRSTPWSARTSLGVFGKKVLAMPAISSTCHPLPDIRRQVGQYEGHQHKRSGDQLQVVWVQSPAQGDRHQQPEQN